MHISHCQSCATARTFVTCHIASRINLKGRSELTEVTPHKVTHYDGIDRLELRGRNDRRYIGWHQIWIPSWASADSVQRLSIHLKQITSKMASIKTLIRTQSHFLSSDINLSFRLSFYNKIKFSFQEKSLRLQSRLKRYNDVSWCCKMKATI